MGDRFPTLTTDRVTLRKVNFEDASFIHFMRSDPIVNEHVDRPATQNVKDAEFFIDQRHQDFFHRKSIYWGIELNTTGFLVGTITLWNLDMESGHGELGYDLHPSFQKRGLMIEAAESVIEYGLKMLGLQKIIAITSPKNESSLHLLTRLGFKSMNKNDLPEIDVEKGLLGFEKTN